MSYPLLLAVLAVLIPLVIGMICVIARRDIRSVILVLSVSALSLATINFLMYALELAKVVPITTTSAEYSIYDSIRVLCSNVAFYSGIAAWVLGLQRAAQTARLGWMAAVLVTAMLSLICWIIEREPYYFFTRLNYTVGVAFLVAVCVHVVSMVTLIYALATRQRIVPVIFPSAPSLYQPMYPQPTPYNMPVSYAPPPPVVLPAPQPQPPMMTTPS